MNRVLASLASTFVVALSAMACGAPELERSAPNAEQNLTGKGDKKPPASKTDPNDPKKSTNPDDKSTKGKGADGSAGGKEGGTKAGTGDGEGTDETPELTKEQLACMDSCIGSDAKAKSILASMDACNAKCGPKDEACFTKCDEAVGTSCEDAESSCTRLFEKCMPKCFPDQGEDEAKP